MSVKLLTEHHLDFLSLKEVDRLVGSLHLSKCHIVGNHVVAHMLCVLAQNKYLFVLMLYIPVNNFSVMSESFPVFPS